MKVTIDTSLMREVTTLSKITEMSTALNKIVGSAEYVLLQILLDEVAMKEATPTLAPSATPCLTNFKSAYGITYQQAGTKIRERYLKIRTSISEQLVATYTKVQALNEQR